MQNSSTQNQATNRNVSEMYSYFIIVPLNDMAISYYNTFRDPGLLLETLRKSLFTSNPEIQIVLGDGPMPLAGRAIPIQIDSDHPLDVDGRDRHSVIARGVLEVSDWIHVYGEIGVFPPVLDLILLEP
jgi:hypothetical protein